MKKILLSIALVLGLNQSIQPSYALGALNFAKSAFGSFKSSMTAGNIALYGVIPSIGTYLAYKVGNQDLEKKLSDIASALDEVKKKDPNFYDTWGTPGKILGGVLTAYAFLKYGISEISQFYSILGMVNAIKNIGQGRQPGETDGRLQQQQPQGPGQKLKPAQRAYRAQAA